MRKRLSFAVTAAVATLAGATGTGIIKKEEPVQRTLHFTGPGPHTLEVRTITGNVRIEGYDGADVVMTDALDHRGFGG